MPHVIPVSMRRAVDLPEEACVLRVAVVVVGAAQAHGRLELEVGRLARGDELLFLLQHGKQHFLADAA